MLKKTKRVLAVTTLGILTLGNMTIMAKEQPVNADNEITTEHNNTIESSEVKEDVYSAEDDNEDASVKYVNVEWEAPSIIKDIGDISIKESINVGNESIPLYCTFDSPQEALTRISDNAVVKMLKEEYGFEDISDANWKQYYDAMFEMLDSPDCPDWYNESNEDLWQLRSFFDIYENEEKNDEIISNIKNGTNSGTYVPYKEHGN